jgi:hypothetical protein
MKKLIAFALFCSLGFIFFTCGWAKDTVELKGKTGNFIIVPNTLAVFIIPSDSAEKIALTQDGHYFDEVRNLKHDAHTATWDYPQLKIHIETTTDDRGLKFTFSTATEQNLRWPTSTLSPQVAALILPEKEGLYIPVHDPFWLREFSKYPDLSLTLPFWGIQYDTGYIASTIMPMNDVDTDFQVHQQQGQLYITNIHHFKKREGFPVYEILFHFPGNSPISPALDYRLLLKDQHQFASLKQKILENADVSKLLGAFHVWLQGEGQNTAVLQELQQLDIKHLWLGYHSDKNNLTKAYVQTAENRGYLIAPYTNFNILQNPKFSNNTSPQWLNQLWPTACILQANGSIQFSSNGCTLSAQALRLSPNGKKNIEYYMNDMIDKGHNSIFLNCDATWPLYEDYSTHHPMTRLQDLTNRLERMRYMSSIKKVVLGSATGLVWASPVIAYTDDTYIHACKAIQSNLRDKKFFPKGWSTYNKWFKAYRMPNSLKHQSYDPRHHLPLYQAVFHDSVITAYRLENNELLNPKINVNKILLQNLYNVPSSWTISKYTLPKIKNYFIADYQFFSALHRITGLEPLIQFAWLTPDHRVQQTQFGNRLILTANFSNKNYNDIPTGCIQAQWNEDNSKETFCPKAA